MLSAAVVTCAIASSDAGTKEPIAGRWEFAGGVVEFVPRGSRFVSKVIRKRPGVPCPQVNDRDGQIVLSKRASRRYEGTWVWFDASTCRVAGKGATTIVVSADGTTATMVANPPRGVESRPITFRLSRAGAAPAGTTLFGRVGPGFTISLATRGTVRPGRYSIVVDDRSPSHNFRLSGPGVNAAITSVPFSGRGTLAVVLKPGRYTFLCEPHAPAMRGSFSVG